MEIFRSLDISTSGMDVYQTWLDAVSDNIANVNTIRPTSEAAFRERMVVVSSVQDGGKPAGARVTRAEFGSAEGLILYDPTNPLADEDGMVRLFPHRHGTDAFTAMRLRRRGRG
jgi:flagellar basal-body rod protein FlgC